MTKNNFLCCICNNVCKNNQKFTTECKHIFCNGCITHWLLLNDTCCIIDMYKQ